MIAGFRCAVCGELVDIATPLAFTCPNATEDDPYHVLQIVEADAPVEVDGDVESDAANPFVRYRERLAWWAFARSNGLTEEVCLALTDEVAGDFRVTPFERSDVLSRALGVEVWAKDETGNVAGSHKARHLASILLHLRAAEVTGVLPERLLLAIASCGNAALAAATLADRVHWPLEVFVPSWMNPSFGARIRELGATINTCVRDDDDPPGDPAMAGFRLAIEYGALPFSVQGPVNAYCLDGGRTIGWEIADQVSAHDVDLAALYVQVGAGTLATCASTGVGRVPLRAVQTAGCAPLAAALERASAFEHPERHWAEVMKPWPDPHSLADGILDDETYDWIGVRERLIATGGSAVVASEDLVIRAHELALEAGFNASPTGTAGLAGALADQLSGSLGDGPIAVIISGVSTAS